MQQSLILIVALCVAQAFQSLDAAETEMTAKGESPKRYWYAIGLASGQAVADYHGWSPLSPEELGKKMQANEMILRNDVVYFDQARVAQDMDKWVPWHSGQTYLNPQFIIVITPLKDDPRKFTK